MNYEGKCVLVIDDSETERFILKKILLELGFDVTDTKDAFEAISILDQKRYVPDLIIVDANMPGMTGYQAIKQIKIRENLKEIPIIMCTVDDVKANERWAKYNGANELLGKPINKSLLVNTLKKIL